MGDKFIVNVYKLAGGIVSIDDYKVENLDLMFAVIDFAKRSKYTYYIEAGELIYKDTDKQYYKEHFKWLRRA